MSYATDNDLFNMSNEQLQEERNKLQNRRDFILKLMFRNDARAVPPMLEFFKEPKELDMEGLRESILYEYAREENNVQKVTRHLPTGKVVEVEPTDVHRTGFWLITAQWPLPLRLDFTLTNGTSFSLNVVKKDGDAFGSTIIVTTKEI